MRRFKKVLLVMLVLLLLSGGGIFFFVRSQWAASWVADQIGERLGVDVTIARVEVGLSRRVAVRGLRVVAEGREIARLDRVVVDLEGTPLEGFSIAAFEIVGGRIVVVERPDGSILGVKEEEPGPQVDGPPSLLPSVRVREVDVFFEGEGPIREQLCRYVASDWETSLRGVDVAFSPLETGAFDFEGRFEVAPLGELALEGRVHPGDSRLSIEGKLREVRVDRAFSRCLSEKWADHVTAHGIDARVDLSGSVRLHHGQVEGVDLRASLFAGRATPQFGNIAIDQVSADLQFDGQRLDILSAGASVGRSRIDLEGNIDRLLAEPLWDLAVRVRDLDLDATVEPLLRETEAYVSYKDFDPHGVIDVQAKIATPAEGGLPEVSQWEVTLKGVNASYEGRESPEDGTWTGFPYRVEDLWGKVNGVPGRIELHDLRGTGGGGSVLIRGSIDGDLSLPGHEIEIEVGGIRLDQRLRHAIAKAGGEEAAEVYDSFHPQGEVYGLVRLLQEEGRPGSELRIEIRFGEVSAVFNEFPYPLTDVHGTLIIDGSDVLFQAIEGRHGPAKVVVDGAVRKDQGLEVDIRGEGIVLDSDFKTVLVEAGIAEGIEAWEELRPNGIAECVARFVQPEDGELLFDIKGALDHATVRPRAFPILIEDVKTSFHFGDLYSDVFRVDVPDFRGQRAGGAVEASLVFEDDVDLVLQVTLKNQEIDLPFRAALEEAAPEEAAYIEEINASGNLDIGYRMTSTGSFEGALGVFDLLVHEGHAEFDFLPDPVDRISGRVSLLPSSDEEAEGYLVQLDDLEGLMSGGWIEIAKGSLLFDEEGLTADFEGRVSDVAITENFSKIFPEDERDLVDRLAARGIVDIAPFQIHLQSPDDPEAPTRMTYEGDALLRDATFERFIPAESIRARIHIEGQRGIGLKSFASRWTIRDLEFKVDDHAFTDFRANLRAQPEGVFVNQLSGSYAGGTFPEDRNNVAITLDDKNKFDIELAFEDADLSRMFPSKAKDASLAGRLDGSFAFHGESGAPHKLRGHGRLEVHEGYLWELPLFSILIQKGLLRRMGLASGPVFREGTLDFRVDDGRVDIRSLSLDSAVLRLSGKGGIGPSGLSLSVVPGVAPRIPIVSSLIDPIFDLIKAGTLAFSVRGSFSEPDVSWDPRLLNPFGAGSEVPDWPILPRTESGVSRPRF